MNKKFTILDSGVRQDYQSGMRRDTQEGKPDYTLIDLVFLTRLAEHMAKGAVKYGRGNWTLANSELELLRFKSSALRHMFQWLRGDADEDHMAAVAFNLAAAENCKLQMDNKKIPITDNQPQERTEPTRKT